MTSVLNQRIRCATGLATFADNDDFHLLPPPFRRSRGGGSPVRDSASWWHIPTLVTTDDAPQMRTSVREQKKRSLSLNLPQFPLIEKIYLSFPHELLA